MRINQSDVVILIDKEPSDFDLTINKQYQVIEATHKYIVIKTDCDFIKHFRKRKFKLLNQTRDKKIKKLLKSWKTKNIT